MSYLSDKDAGTNIKIQSRKFEFEVKLRSGFENDENSFLDNKHAPAHTLPDKNSHDGHGNDNDLVQHTSAFKNDSS